MFSWKFWKHLAQRLAHMATLSHQIGFRAFWAKLHRYLHSRSYSTWVQSADNHSMYSANTIEGALSALTNTPLFSIILPTWESNPELLEASIQSIQKQWYRNFEIAIVDDGSLSTAVHHIIQKYSQEDQRIRYVLRNDNGHISNASNTALNLCKGDFVVLMDHDDLLAPHALLTLALNISKYPHGKFFFSDEDKIDLNSRRFSPHYKPGWDRTLLRSQNYICHLTAIERNRMLPFLTGFEGAQDWDLFLRVTEKLSDNEIIHIPFCLYHWRAIDTSTAYSASAKPYIENAQKKAVSSHLKRINFPSDKLVQSAGTHHITIQNSSFTTNKEITIVLDATTSDNYPLTWLNKVREKTPKNLPVSFVVLGSEEQIRIKTNSALASDVEFKVSQSLEAYLQQIKAEQNSAEFIVFLSNETAPSHPQWIYELLTELHCEKTALCTARVIDQYSKVYSTGIVLNKDYTQCFLYRGLVESDPGYMERSHCTQQVPIVPAYCFGVRTEVLLELVNNLPLDEMSSTLPIEFKLSLSALNLGYHNVYAAGCHCNIPSSSIPASIPERYKSVVFRNSDLKRPELCLSHPQMDKSGSEIAFTEIPSERWQHFALQSYNKT